jgi:uncharacterized protein DUF6941
LEVLDNMELSFAMYATAAEFAPDGKLYLLGGGLEFLHVRELPATASLALVVRLGVRPEECGHEHTLAIDFLSPSGQPVFPPRQVQFAPTRHPIHPERDTYMSFAVNFPGTIFSEAGEYAVRLSVDGRAVGQMAFDVVQGEPPSTSALAPDSLGASQGGKDR